MEIAQLRVKENIKNFVRKMQGPPINSGIEQYEDRVVFSAGILYPILRDFYSIRTKYCPCFSNNRDKFIDWIKWPDEEKVDLKDVYTYMFSKMDTDELHQWLVRLNEFSVTPPDGKYDVEVEHRIIDIINHEVSKRSE